MPRPLTTQWARPRLGDYDGHSVGVLLVDHDGAAAAADTMQFVSEVTGNELSGSPYVRGTVDVTFTQDGDAGIFDLDPEGTAYAPDTTGFTPAGVWFFDTTGADDTAHRLLVFSPVDEAPGFTDWEVASPPRGLARITRGVGEFAQLSDVDWSTPPTDGQLFAWSAAALGGAGAVAPVGPPATAVTWDPDGVDLHAPNRYTTVTEFIAACASSPWGSSRRILADLTIPADTAWDVRNGTIVGDVSGGRHTVHFSDGATLVNPATLTFDYALDVTGGSDTVPPMAATGVREFIFGRGCVGYPKGAAPLIRFTGDGDSSNGGAVVSLFNSSIGKGTDFGDTGTAPAIEWVNASDYGACEVMGLWGAPALHQDSLKSDGDVKIVATSPSADMNHTHGDVSGLVTYESVYRKGGTALGPDGAGDASIVDHAGFSTYMIQPGAFAAGWQIKLPPPDGSQPLRIVLIPDGGGLPPLDPSLNHPTWTVDGGAVFSPTLSGPTDPTSAASATSPFVIYDACPMPGGNWLITPAFGGA